MIKIRQCQEPCCLIQTPSRRFWQVTVPGQTITTTSFPEAVQIADAHTKIGIPS